MDYEDMDADFGATPNPSSALFGPAVATTPTGSSIRCPRHAADYHQERHERGEAPIFRFPTPVGWQRGVYQQADAGEGNHFPANTTAETANAIDLSGGISIKEEGPVRRNPYDSLHKSSVGMWNRAAGIHKESHWEPISVYPYGYESQGSERYSPHRLDRSLGATIAVRDSSQPKPYNPNSPHSVEPMAPLMKVTQPLYNASGMASTQQLSETSRVLVSQGMRNVAVEMAPAGRQPRAASASPKRHLLSQLEGPTSAGSPGCLAGQSTPRRRGAVPVHRKETPKRSILRSTDPSVSGLSPLMSTGIRSVQQPRSSNVATPANAKRPQESWHPDLVQSRSFDAPDLAETSPFDTTLSRNKSNRWALRVGRTAHLHSGGMLNYLDEDSDSGDEDHLAHKSFMKEHAGQVVTRESLRKGKLHDDSSTMQRSLYHQSLMSSPRGASTVGRMREPEPTLTLASRPRFTMPEPPPHLDEEARRQQRSKEGVDWHWKYESGFQIPFSLLLYRGLDVKKPDHLEVVNYHMDRQLIRDIWRLSQGCYLARYKMSGGIPHDRFCAVAMNAPSKGEEPVPSIIWKQHYNSYQILERALLSTLVGVSFDAHAKAFGPHKIYPPKDPERQRRRDMQLVEDESETSSLDSMEGGPEALYIEGPMIGGSKRQELSIHNAFTLWFLDCKSMEPKSVDLVAKSREMAELWVNCMQGLVAINSVSIGRVNESTQSHLMDFARSEVERDEGQGLLDS